MNPKPSILITGAVSLLGKYLCPVLSPTSQLSLTFHKTKPQNDYGISSWQQLNVTDAAAVTHAIATIQPQIVIHLAGLSNIDFCESHPKASHAVNVESTKIVCDALKGTDAHLIFVSSSMVFDGSAGQYSETDMPNPINIYGKHKYEGEKIVQQYTKSTVIRLSTLFGWPPPGARSNDLPYYLEQLKQTKELHLVNDRLFNPLSATTAAQAIAEIITKEQLGMFHLGGAETVSRFTFVQKIIEAFEIKNPPVLKPVANDYFKNLAPRPKNVTLNIEKIKTILGVSPKPISNELLEIKKESIPLLRKEG